MIIQSAPPGQPRFIVRQTAHARLAGQLAHAFGNDTFAPLNPREPLEFMVTHHDEGWVGLDELAYLNPQTNFPYHLTETPLPMLLDARSKSPDFNEAHHPLSGLLVSMHTYGLYHEGYGLSDKFFLKPIPPEYRPAVESMLKEELVRQARLKAQLSTDTKTAVWAKEEFLFHNYKLLHFFDSLALYFNLTHTSQHTETMFNHVPQAISQDVTIVIRPLGEGNYALMPYPFRSPAFTIACMGYYFTPSPTAKWSQLMRETTPTYQSFTLVAGSG